MLSVFRLQNKTSPARTLTLAACSVSSLVSLTRHVNSSRRRGFLVITSTEATSSRVEMDNDSDELSSESGERTSVGGSDQTGEDEEPSPPAVVDLTELPTEQRISIASDDSSSSRRSGSETNAVVDVLDSPVASRGYDVIDVESYELRRRSRKRRRHTDAAAGASPWNDGGPSAVVVRTDSESNSDDLLSASVFPIARKKVVVVVDDDSPAKVRPACEMTGDLAGGPSSSSASSVEKTSGGGLTCPICFDSTDSIKASGRQLMSTVCGHVFCDACLKDSFRVLKQCCPTCRRKLTNKQYHPLFV